MKELEAVPLWAIVLLVLILLVQSTYLFIDAHRRNKLYWFWGLYGLIQFPVPVLLYVLFVIKPWQNKNTRR